MVAICKEMVKGKKRQDSGNEVVEERSRSGKVKAFYFEPGKIDVLRESLEIFKL